MSRAEQHRALAAEALHRLQLTPLADDSATDEESPINNKSKTIVAMNPISATATTTTAATTDTTKLKDGEEGGASRSLQFRCDDEEDDEASSSPRPNHPTDGFAAADRPKVTVFRPSPPSAATTVQNVPNETASGNRSNPATTSHGVAATPSLTKRSEAVVAVGTAEVPQPTTRAAGSHHHSSSEALPPPPPAAAAVVAPPLRVVGKSPQVPRSITVVSSSLSGTTTKINTVPLLKSHSPVAVSTSSQQRDASLSSTMAPAPILAHRSPSPDLDANAVHPAAVYKSTPQAAVPIEVREELSPTATPTAEAGQGGTTGVGPTPPRSNATTGGRSLHPPPPSSSLKRSPSWGGSSSTVGARSSPNAIERTLRLRLETAENRAASLETQVASLEETVRLLHKQAALQPTVTTTATATSSVRSEDHHLTTHKDNNNNHHQHQQQELRLANLQKILQDEIKSKRSLERSMEDLGVVLQRHVRELQLVSEERDQLAARNSVLVLEVEAARRELREVRQELGSGAIGLARKGSSTLGRNPSASPLRKKTSSMGSLLSGGAAAEKSRNRTPTPTQQPAATSRISRQSSVASVCRTPSPVVRSSAAAPTTTTTATHHPHPASPRQVTFQANHQVVRSRQPTPERRPRSPVAAAPPARGLSPKPVTGAAVRAVPSATLPPPPTSTSSRPSAGAAAAAPPPPSSAKRTVSPILARQQLAAASFLKATNASAIRSGGAAAAARPKLTSAAEPATEKRKTALVMRDGKAFNMSEVPPSQRRRTPVSERIEAAVAKIAALEAERQQQQQHR